jgi:MFS family permease
MRNSGEPGTEAGHAIHAPRAAVKARALAGSIGWSMAFGLFIAYLDRTNLSVSITQVAQDLRFAGAHFTVTSSWLLTIFLIGYAIFNIAGGFLTRKLDPKHVLIGCVAIWSVATLIGGVAGSIWLLLVCRFILGAAEGVYWPQQSRVARAWFAPESRTRANGLIQYYGQYGSLALGFLLLTPLYGAFGWRALFLMTGAVGLILVVPLYMAVLRPERDAPYLPPARTGSGAPLSLASFGGMSFLLLVISYLSQGMLFWGITLWIPLVTKSLGFTGASQALADALPYLAAVLLAIPITALSDRTGKRVLIASLGQILPGLLLLLLPEIANPSLKLAIITIALGYYASSYTPNIWSILQASVAPEAVGPASGIINGIGAGGGGTIAGFLVAFMDKATGSYMSGFVVLGLIVAVGGFCLLAYGRMNAKKLNAAPF